MPLNCGSVLKLEPMLNPLVTSSSVMGDHSGDEHSLQCLFAAGGGGFYHVEEEAEESLAVGGLLIGLGAVGGEYGVGKVVVLIDNKVEVEF